MRAETPRTLLDRYHLLAEIGRGGMGRVWRAHDTRLNRTVAVKEILLGPWLDEDARGRMSARAQREAQATAMGGHRNIVTVHDIVEDDGRPWIVMEFLSGRSLYALVREEGPVDARLVARWGLDLLSALSTAHEQGITHRDVKPENVMVTDSGRVVLTDFGIATIADTTALTQTGGMPGSPAYLAPERLATSPATPASDLWSLGVTLYHAATGISPFRREAVSATLNAIITEEPADLLEHGPLDEAVRGLLVKEPVRRINAAHCQALLSGMAGPAVFGEGTGAGPALLPPGGHASSTAPTAAVFPTGSAPTRQETLPTAPVSPQQTFGADGTQPAAVPPPSAVPTSGGESAVPAGPRRGVKLSWPVVVLTLGLASLVAAAALLVALNTPGSEPDSTVATSAGPGDEAAGGSGEGSEEGAGADVTEEGGDAIPSAEGMTWQEDPQGFGILVPDGWIRRVDGSGIFYDSPTDAAYLQVDLAEHPTDNEYQHILDQQANVRTSGRMPDYQLLRIEDVTGATGFHSAAEWDFTWNSDGQVRHLLARNIAVEPGTHFTLAWASPESLWTSYDVERIAALDSFNPA